MGNRLEKGTRINRVLGMKSKVKFKIWVVVNSDVNFKTKENR